ncbi:MAG: delta-aminolevulinic acid dehydratase [Clostridiales bacterium]|nr:delta-aminolevulinic acid dehydratase [Clostridiales bacterium]
MKNILIVVIGNTGNESESLRQSLEAFGYFVATSYVGRPNDFIAILNGQIPFDPDCIILSCHGDDGRIVMPPVGEDVYQPDEPRGNFTAMEVDHHLSVHDKLILNLGCTTGNSDLANAFSKQNTYIAPCDYVEGNAALYFAISLFYEISKADTSLQVAFEVAKAHDNETSLFHIF